MRVYDFLEDNGTAYMAIDFIDGKDLHDILESTDMELSSLLDSALEYPPA